MDTHMLGRASRVIEQKTTQEHQSTRERDFAYLCTHILGQTSNATPRIHPRRVRGGQGDQIGHGRPGAAKGGQGRTRGSQRPEAARGCQGRPGAARGGQGRPEAAKNDQRRPRIQNGRQVALEAELLENSVFEDKRKNSEAMPDRQKT